MDFTSLPWAITSERIVSDTNVTARESISVDVRKGSVKNDIFGTSFAEIGQVSVSLLPKGLQKTHF